MSSTENYDIIVVGAGVLGVATAYYLQKNSPNKSILLLDRLPAAGQGNTATSAAAVRNMFASSTNQLLTDSSVKFIEHIQENLHFDLTFEKCGYLWLLSDKQFTSPSVKMWMQRMTASGIKYTAYDKHQLKKFIPSLNMDFTGDEEAKLMNLPEVSYALFGPDCGVLDPTKLVAFYLQEFTKLSKIKPRYGVNVTSLLLDADPKLDLPGEPLVWQNKRVNGVRTSSKELRAETVVLATDAWTNKLLDPIGFDSETKAKKRQLFVIHAADKKPLLDLLYTKGFSAKGSIPFTILPSAGVYFRPQLQEKGFWIGCADKVGRAYDYVQTDGYATAETAYYENSIYPVLAKYFPVFQGARPVNSWGGGYNYSPDAIPFAYKESGFMVVNGTSGSGIMKADAVARIADALYRAQPDAELFGGKRMPSNALSIKDRKVEVESVII